MKRHIILILLITLLLCTTSTHAKEMKKIGVTVITTHLSFFSSLVAGITDEAKRINEDVIILTKSAEVDIKKQNDQIDYFIKEGVDAIILNTVDTEGIAPAVLRAKEAGIVVVGVDAVANNADVNIVNNNRQGGEQVGKFIADKLGGRGNVIIITGAPITSTFDRISGIKEVFSNYPEITILSDSHDGNATKEGGRAVMSELLEEYNNIDAVFSIFDESSIGAMLAIQEAGRADKIFVTGIGGTKQALEEIRQPGSIYAATSTLTPYFLGTEAAKTANELLAGEKPSKELIQIPVDLITKENVTLPQFIKNSY